MTHRIKQLSATDLDELTHALSLVWTVFNEFEAPDYSAEGIEQFKTFIALAHIKEQLEAGTLVMWGFFDGETLAGIMAMRLPNHVTLLFVAKQYHKQGIARKLLETAYIYCKAHFTITTITLNSSPYAVEAYKHLGFKETDSQQQVDGILFTPMEKRI
ncbi:GNAT family N-acetyltransferase [Candidatus Enterococcus mansonii]|nr:GNAT family N-acetyltransferase [Enterococcus sp. 4G2_DIV0659]